ncbi:MAG TPA: hypothetical protein DET40_08130 [Lentisphaeria bacterium]|nr:MAG: hypothetical protein A2X45_10340 [Lentisphaerae bacterium GWF2_50_93]HCE43502.1 hypothetical protein [Lentisphaeria bacterium]
MQWNREQILAMAPDPSAAKSGRDLASERRWSLLASNERAVWGLCQGSGKDPYQTKIDLNDGVGKCSCPSRKFPCKHTLGLFLLFSEKPVSFKKDTIPGWVAEWLDKREDREKKKADKTQDEKKAPDPEAQVKRAANREANVKAGIEETELWLMDLARRGFASVQGEPPAFWESRAARMIDSQAPGLARKIRKMGETTSSGEGWQDRLMEHLVQLYLLMQGYGRIASLPQDTQQDIRNLIGWPQDQDEILAQDGISDRWLILSGTFEEEGRLKSRKTWLYGENTSQFAYLLDYAVGNSPFDAGLPTGSAMEGELVMFKGSYPRRALIKKRTERLQTFKTANAGTSITKAYVSYSDNLLRNPWTEVFPFFLKDVVPHLQDDVLLLSDPEGFSVPVSPVFVENWQLIGLAGGRPVSVFGEWDGRFLFPLGVCWESGFHCFRRSKEVES